MDRQRINRREFLKTGAAGAAVVLSLLRLRAFKAALIITSACLVVHAAGPGPALFQPGLIATATAQSQASPQFALKDGDRVVFYGDSITEQRLYTTYVEHYCTTHYPDRRITFINTGWGGDKVTANDCKPCAGVGGLARIKRDLLAYQPTVVTLLFGMNDGQYQEFDPAVLKVYENGLRAIITEIKSKTHARIYVMTPTVYDGTRHTPWSRNDKYNDVLDRYSESAKQIAASEGLPVIDLHAVTTAALNRAKQKEPAYTFLPDGVHPAEDGQLVMAAEILKAWGAAAAGTAVHRAPASNLTVVASLPWPTPSPSETLNKVWPDIIGLGNIRILIAGAQPGHYWLSIDGGARVQVSADELQQGVDITRLSPKAVVDSEQLASLIRKRADVYFFRWRQLELPYGKDYKAAPAAASAIDSLIEEMRDRSRAVGAFHRYEIQISPVADRPGSESK